MSTKNYEFTPRGREKFALWIKVRYRFFPKNFREIISWWQIFFIGCPWLKWSSNCMVGVLCRVECHDILCIQIRIRSVWRVETSTPFFYTTIASHGFLLSFWTVFGESQFLRDVPPQLFLAERVQEFLRAARSIEGRGGIKNVWRRSVNSWMYKQKL